MRSPTRSLRRAAAVLSSAVAALGACAGKNVAIEYRSTGGFGFSDDHLVIEKDGQATLSQFDRPALRFTVPREILRRLEQSLARSRFSELRSKYLPPKEFGPTPDGRIKTIAYGGKRVRFDLLIAPAELAEAGSLLSQVVQQAPGPFRLRQDDG